MNRFNLAARPIVLVDDDEDDRFFATRRLKQAGLTNPIVTLAGGEAAIQYLRQACADAGEMSALPSVVFLDIKMPDMTGHQVLEWAKKEPMLAGVRFVMLSSSSEPEDVERAIRLGADRYLVKHPEPAVFARILAELSSPAVQVM